MTDYDPGIEQIRVLRSIDNSLDTIVRLMALKIAADSTEDHWEEWASDSLSKITDIHDKVRAELE